MRVARAIVGLAIATIGLIAVFDTDLDNSGWWLLAALAAALGVAGLVVAVRPERR